MVGKIKNKNNNNINMIEKFITKKVEKGSIVIAGIILGIIVVITTGIIAIDIVNTVKMPRYGTEIPQVVALFETTLATEISSSATSTMTLTSGTTDDGTELSGYYGFIINEGESNEEFVLATCSSTACTDLTRGISVITGNTNIATLQHSHRRGASVKITNHPILAILARIMNGDETFPNIISYATSTLSFTEDAQIITKKFAEDLSYHGSPDATTSVKGISE